MSPSPERACGQPALVSYIQIPQRSLIRQSAPFAESVFVLARCSPGSNRRLRMVGEVNSGRVCDTQHEGADLKLLASLRFMRLHQERKSHILVIEQSIQSEYLFPGLHVSKQRGQWIGCHPRGRFHGSGRASNVVELTASKSPGRPAFWTQDVLCVHLSIVSVCYMCSKDRRVRVGRSHTTLHERESSRFPSRTAHKC